MWKMQRSTPWNMLSAVKSVNSIAVQTCKKDKQSSLADFNISLFDFILLSFTCRLQNRNIDYFQIFLLQID